jgi:hypothetical protein
MLEATDYTGSVSVAHLLFYAVVMGFLGNKFPSKSLMKEATNTSEPSSRNLSALWWKRRGRQIKRVADTSESEGPDTTVHLPVEALCFVANPSGQDSEKDSVNFPLEMHRYSGGDSGAITGTRKTMTT